MFSNSKSFHIRVLVAKAYVVDTVLIHAALKEEDETLDFLRHDVGAGCVGIVLLIRQVLLGVTWEVKEKLKMMMKCYSKTTKCVKLRE